nr:uncharacterized protein LOC124817976 [Hydra vulgaris]
MHYSCMLYYNIASMHDAFKYKKKLQMFNYTKRLWMWYCKYIQLIMQLNHHHFHSHLVSSIKSHSKISLFKLSVTTLPKDSRMDQSNLNWVLLKKSACFQAKGDQPAVVSVNISGWLVAAKLVHVSDNLKCNPSLPGANLAALTAIYLMSLFAMKNNKLFFHLQVKQLFMMLIENFNTVD